MNGVHTQGENIADVGGFKAAYGAYQRFVHQNKPEPTLPGLQKYTQNQLFWISAAHSACMVTRPELDIDQYTNDEHTPNKFRIIGSFSSLSEFGNDFNCPSTSQMNPTKKCEVW